MIKTISPILLILVYSINGYSQKKVKLIHADKLKGSITNGNRIDWVIGNVIFVQNKTTIYCDSAQFFRSENSVDAFGYVKITDGDSVVLTAQTLKYDGNKKIAYLRKDVVFEKTEKATLFTDFLDFDRTMDEVRFFKNGKLIDSTNTLTSKKGYYDLNTNMASFKSDVVVINKDYKISSDTLQYNSDNKFVYFHSLTKVEDSTKRVAYYDHGFYNTNEKKSMFRNGELQTPSFLLKSDSIFVDNKKRLYKANGNVVLTAKEDDMNIYGDEGYHNKKTQISKVFGNAYAAQFKDEKDTLYIVADTLVSVDNTDPSKKYLLAYNHVRIFKKDLQGLADSLVYKTSDSTIYFYGNPILWTDENQLTADSIRVIVKNKNINSIILESNSFVSSEDSLNNYNQIKGKKMTASFHNKTLQKVIVEGNGESLYFALQEKELKNNNSYSKKSQPSLAGMNKIICSNMKIMFKKGRMNNISFYIKPEATFIPPHDLDEINTSLKGFFWHEQERPERETLFIKSDTIK